MAVMVVSVFLNVLLDPFLIFGFSANPLFGWLAAVPLVAALDPVGLQEALFAATGFTGFGIEGAAMATIFSRGSPPRSASGCCSPRGSGRLSP